MRTILKKAIVIFISGFIILLSGCAMLKTYESEDFYYKIYGNQYQEPFVTIIKLTETGLQKETLFIPAEIDGMPVRNMQQGTTFGVGASLISDNLRTLYLERNIHIQYPRYVYCPNLERAFVLDVEELESDYELSIDSYYYEGGGELPIYIYSESINMHEHNNIFYANISYRWNYEDAPRNGCYWLDNVEEGDVLLKPDNPTRKGYTFDGWYRDEDCSLEWDFETDTCSFANEKEIKLYAKWIEKED